MLMNIIEYAAGVFFVLCVLAAAHYLAKRAWKDIQDHDIPEIDFDALELELQSAFADLKAGEQK